MTSLNQFIEPITVAGNPIGAQYKAYKMDSTDQNKNMRKLVNIGTCHCCDYFFFQNDCITLIEETRLLNRVENIRKKYDYLNDKDKDEVVNNRLPEIMQLKVYGAMLVLCRLAAKLSNEKRLIQNKRFNFWFVASKIESDEEKIYFDNQKDSLHEKIKEVLGTELINNVDVLSSDTLRKRLSRECPHTP